MSGEGVGMIRLLAIFALIAATAGEARLLAPLLFALQPG